jgi:hypothetical protein
MVEAKVDLFRVGLDIAELPILGINQVQCIEEVGLTADNIDM